MIINMTTFAGRQKHYIDKTLESLFASDGRDVAVNLILGSSDTSHVERYRDVANIVAWDEVAEWQAMEGNLRRNCTINAIRALNYGADDYCLCCEDDIVFVKGWFTRLMETIGEIDGKEYVLNLAHRGARSPSKRYIADTRTYLCGAQGLFYPSKSFRSAVAAFVQENISNGMNDALIGDYARRHAALYSTVPFLIGHVGGVSSFTQPKPPEQKNNEEPSVSRATDESAQPEVIGTQPPVPTVPAPERNAVADRPAERTARPARPDAGVEQPAERRAQQSVGAQIRNGAKSFLSDRATSELMMSLLRVSLGTGALPEPQRLAERDWEHFTFLATHHGVAPILYRALIGWSESVPPHWLRKFKVQYVGNVVHNQLARALMGEVGAAFAAEQIPVIVMKGVALLRTLYEDPGLRVLGDVDLLVDDGDVERACAQLEHLGLEPLKSDHTDQRGPLCQIHRMFQRPQPRAIPVELHWRLFEPYLPYVFDLREARKRARPLSGMPANVLTMAPEHELTHLCVHLDRHAVTYRSLVDRQDWYELLVLPQGLARLGWLYDIALYLQKRSADIDWDSFIDTARRWVIEPRLYAPLELSRRALGVGPPAEVLRALSHHQPRFVERVAHRVVFASYRAEESQRTSSAPGAARWLSPLAAHVLRLANTWVSVFPPSAYLHAKYGTQGTALELRGKHFREVMPQLWEEARDRLSATAAAQPSSAHRHDH